MFYVFIIIGFKILKKSPSWLLQKIITTMTRLETKMNEYNVSTNMSDIE